MTLKIIMNKKTKQRFLAPEAQILMLTNKYHFRAYYLKQEYSQKRIFYMPTPLDGFVDLPDDAYIELNIPGKVTYKSVIDGEWILVPETPATKILYGD